MMDNFEGANGQNIIHYESMGTHLYVPIDDLMPQDVKEKLLERIESAIKNSMVTVENGHIVCRKLVPPYETITI